MLWKKFTNGFRLGLSGGRVQSVALKLIVEREREINNFIPQEYWNISVNLKGRGADKEGSFDARVSGAKLLKFDPISPPEAVLSAIWR